MSELIDREATVKQICKMGEMVGGHDRDVVISIALFVQDDRSAFPTVFTCNACKNMGNERECVDCHDYSNYVHYEQRPQGKWEYLKEHIIELRDADGKLNQKQTCQFILNLMGVIEREGEEE